MEKEKVEATVRTIKQSFRLLMNGVTAQSMRDKGVQYKLNWGASLLHLREMAAEYEKDYDLAIALWKKPIRECKILATLLMPTEKLLPEVAEIWMEQTETQEMAELLALHVFQYVDYAPRMAFAWIAKDQPLYQICGYHILSRRFASEQIPDERGINEYLDQVETALTGKDLAVRHAAYNSLMRFCDLGEIYESLAQKALQSTGLL